MSENALSADNQQGSLTLVATKRSLYNDPSETTRRTPISGYTRNEILAYLHGAMHDASLNKKRRVRFAQKYREWLESLQCLLKTAGSNSWIYKEGKDRNVYVLETVCADLHFDFDPLNLSTEQQKIAYLRGFFDAEGGIPRNGKRFYIQLVQKDRAKIKALKQILQKLRISTGEVHNPSRRVDPDYWRIFVSARSHKRFAEIIGSLHPIKAEIFRNRMMI